MGNKLPLYCFITPNKFFIIDDNIFSVVVPSVHVITCTRIDMFIKPKHFPKFYQKSNSIDIDFDDEMYGYRLGMLKTDVATENDDGTTTYTKSDEVIVDDFTLGYGPDNISAIPIEILEYAKSIVPLYLDWHYPIDNIPFDYNALKIKWCSEHLPILNDMLPIIKHDDGIFNAVLRLIMRYNVVLTNELVYKESNK